MQYVGQTAADAGIFSGAHRERAFYRNGIGVAQECPITGDIGSDLISCKIGHHAVAFKMPYAGHDADSRTKAMPRHAVKKSFADR